MKRDWSTCQALNTLCKLWMNQVQMALNVVGRWRVGLKLRVLSVFVESYAFISRGCFIEHSSWLFYCMVMKQCYEGSKIMDEKVDILRSFFRH